jgi:small subunit ribosomal protein S13
VRLCDTDLNGNLKIERSITRIRGVSHAFSRAVRVKAGFKKDRKLGDLSDDELKKLEKIILNPLSQGIQSFILNRQKDYDTGADKHLTSTELDLEKKNDIALMRSIKSYKGVRHAIGLKVRGQRTKSTGRKGSAVGVSKKKLQPARKGGSK